MFKRLSSYIKSLLKEKSGKYSAMRLITLASSFSIVGVYVAQNIISMIHRSGFVDFPQNSVMALLVLVGGKVTQSFGEKLPTPPAQ